MDEVRERYVALLMHDPELYGFNEVKFIHSAQVFTNRAVRLRCQYTCSQTRQSDTVPPHTPCSGETREILDEYKYGLIIRREEPFGKRDHRQVWKEFAEQVLKIEHESLLRGYPRAFAFAIGNCLYQHHDDHLRPCDYLGKHRPTLESLGIEIKDTLEMVQWHSYIQRESGEPLQMLALLLLE